MKQAVLVIYKKVNNPRNPIIRFERHKDRAAAEQATANIRGGWTEIYEMTLELHTGSETYMEYAYRGFTIKEKIGDEVYVYEKKDNTTIRHLPKRTLREAIDYINKICFDRQFG